MESRRVRAALLAAVVAGLAAAGIAIPGGDGDDSAALTPPAPHEVSQGTAIPADEMAAVGAVLTAIESGEPLPYEEDGGVFQNREGLLPDQPLGYYREYTVETPGSPDRGARRLVIGEGGETYYTNDHYASFTRIDLELSQ
jgi:ribonuclease T1